MDTSGKRGAQQKKSRKHSSTSRRSTGAAAMPSAGTGAPPSGMDAASGAVAGTPAAAAPSTGGGTSGHPASGFWAGMSLGGSFMDSSPSSSEWLYPPGGFVNSLRMPYPYVNYANGSQFPENSHFVGCPSSRGTPSPNGIGLPVNDTEAQEAGDIDADDSLEPARTDKRLNWSHEEDVRLVAGPMVYHPPFCDARATASATPNPSNAG